MSKNSSIKGADEILNKWKEGYKKEPEKYKERLAFCVYTAWINVLPTDEEYQKFPLSFLCDFDINASIEELVYEEGTSKEKRRVTFLDSILTEATKYLKNGEYFLSLVLYATYFEHWFNDLINCLATTKNLDENATTTLIMMFKNDARLNLLLPLFDLPILDESIHNDLKAMFDARNYFIHYKWKAKTEREWDEQIDKFIIYSEKAQSIIDYLNQYVKENIYNKVFLRKFFSSLIYKQSGIIIKE